VVVQAIREGKKQFDVAFLEDILHHPLRMEKGFFQCIAPYWAGVSCVAVF